MSTLPDNTTSAIGQTPFALPSGVASNPHVKRWSRDEYYRLDQQGWFQDQRVELIDGEIVELSPQSFAHARSVHTVFRILDATFGQEYWVRCQLPMTRAQESEPEPDASVVSGTVEDYSDHPNTAILVVEVSLSTLEFDEITKANLYASMAVPDYWVLDLEHRQLLVHRQSIADESVPFGHRYEQVETIAADGQVAPLEKPDAPIGVADMLPPQK